MSEHIEAAIIARDIGKQYILGGAEQRYDSFRDLLRGAITAPFKKFKKLSGKEDKNLFWALKNIDFEIPRGQVTGIIGRNGAGKSTLLKVLSRITSPTTGEIKIRGRVASLLEVGSGFHPELTGRENIYMNASILGMRREDVHRKLDEIVAFAEVEKFLDTPVKRYSSGMYVRLAFSVAAHVDPDVLLVDEVLAVGDAKFQQRCIGKLGEVGKAGRTVIFVSHNMGLISGLCSHSMYLRDGSIAAYGETRDVIADYMGDNSSSAGGWGAKRDDAVLKKISLTTHNKGQTAFFDYDENAFVNIVFACRKPKQEYIIELLLSDSLGREIVMSYDKDGLPADGVSLGMGDTKIACELPKKLLRPGTYYVRIVFRGLQHGYTEFTETAEISFAVSASGFGLRDRRDGIILPALNWTPHEMPKGANAS